MKKNLKIKNLKPLSINNTYYNFNLTSKARKWMDELFFQLNEQPNLDAMAELREVFEPEKHCFHIELTAYYPRDVFFTKKGTVSAKTHDITNWEKALVDCIFLKKHFEQPFPRGCKNLNTDDKYIVEMRSKKAPHSEGQYEITVGIELVEIEVINNVDESIST